MLCRYRPKPVKSVPQRDTYAHMVTATPFRAASGPAKVPAHRI